MRYRKTRLVGKRNNWLVNIANKIKKKGGNLHETSKVPSKTNSISPDLILYPKNNQNFNKTDNHGHLKNNVIRAESSLVLGGEKYISSIVALNIKNYNSLKDVSMDDLKSIIEDTKGKGVIDFRGDYIFILFNPLITKTYRNEILAVKSGVNILLKIIEHNKKFENKIEFGIGIHNGELIANKHDNKFKYTGIGNSLSLARKMADIDSGRVVISDSIRKKLIRDLDVIKGKEVGSNLTYIVRKVASHSSDMGKLRDLLARNNRSF